MSQGRRHYQRLPLRPERPAPGDLLSELDHIKVGALNNLFAGDFAELHRKLGRALALCLVKEGERVRFLARHPTDREATQRCIEDFEEETGWKPTRSDAVAGALQYREYDVFTRVLMRLKMRQGGHQADPSQDHEYTDWAALDRLAEEFAAQLGD